MALFPADTKVTGGGNQAGQNAYRVLFPNAALAGAPILEAYSAAGTPPTLVEGANDDATFFATDSSIYAIPTFAGDPGADWASSVVAGLATSPAYIATGRQLKGTESILQLVPDTEVSFPAGYTATFNWCYRLGPNSGTVAGDNAHVLAVRYIYTGGVNPTVTWQANEGTEATPIWSDLNGATAKKIAHADTGSIATNPVMTKPTALPKVFSGEAVVQDAP